MTVQWQRFAKGTLVAPVHSPFSAGGGATAACASIAGQARYLVAEGFNAVFVCGTNGESFSCSLAERKAMLEMWMSTEEVRAKKLRMLAHVSCLAPPETVELARHAAALGVDAVSYMVPCFFKPVGDAAVAKMLADFALAVPTTPVLFYHFPDMTGVACSMERVLVAAREAAPNVVGAKFTHNDLADMQASIRAGFDVLIGSGDELLLPSLVLGTAGGFSVPGMMGGNRAILGIFEAYERGDLAAAAEYQDTARQMLGLLKRHPAGFVGAGKALAERAMGGAAPLGPPRPPISALSDAAELERLAAEMGRLIEKAR
ncbi:hypothetical protein EMIHUDRAFT_437491, partial [Emiliania huxleyi CCMP1516]|uniref:N-acetylneuraminate lyase n=2 Tax=Emiliania huxleyi TaxID=2903 RepID=A0A0D3IKQ7_EMIH1